MYCGQPNDTMNFLCQVIEFYCEDSPALAVLSEDGDSGELRSHSQPQNIKSDDTEEEEQMNQSDLQRVNLARLPSTRSMHTNEANEFQTQTRRLEALIFPATTSCNRKRALSFSLNRTPSRRPPLSSVFPHPDLHRERSHRRSISEPAATFRLAKTVPEPFVFRPSQRLSGFRERALSSDVERPQRGEFRSPTEALRPATRPTSEEARPPATSGLDSRRAATVPEPRLMSSDFELLTTELCLAPSSDSGQDL
ncbi:Tudor/PWWP/MBT superfamily protein [Striga asiatica]|uniref:Tudor/PWWP/MBT superfamily protein n=1 Tax=Striga asiatica TaxID=4170 RepID=A0A5A7QUM9_STRAF|nr:Tudor/PWWP/MBT superfamily protein [Striga asiatica]